MRILLQAISNGAVSADWFLVGITTIAVILFWVILTDIRKTLRKVVDKQVEHEVTINEHDLMIKTADKKLEGLNTSQIAEDIANQLKARLPQIKYN